MQQGPGLFLVRYVCKGVWKHMCLFARLYYNVNLTPTQQLIKQLVLHVFPENCYFLKRYFIALEDSKSDGR
jgi:hypothetical protein